MNRESSKKYYWYGIFTVIPVVGLIIGVLLIRKGVLLRNRIIFFIGIFGILLTAFLFAGGLLYSKYSDVGKPKCIELARISLSDVVRDIEYYKIQFHQKNTGNVLRLIKKAGIVR